MWKMLDLAILNARSYLALSVTDVLNSDAAKQAMEDGGAFASQSQTIDQLGGGAYHVGFKIITFVIVIAIMIAGGGLAFANANERDEKKKKIVWAIAGGIVAFGAVGLVIWIANFATGLVTDLGQ